jgi:hypothetical protein
MKEKNLNVDFLKMFQQKEKTFSESVKRLSEIRERKVGKLVPLFKRKLFTPVIYWRYDTQHNNNQHNDTQHNNNQHNDTQHNNNQHNDSQHYDIPHNDTQHKGLVYDTLH